MIAFSAWLGKSPRTRTIPDDEIIERGGVRLLVDKTSARLLGGAEIDYVSSVTATGFAIRNLQRNLDLWVRTLL